MKTKPTPFSQQIESALIRAAARARALSEQTGTPFVVYQNGKVVDLNARPSAAGKHHPP